MTDRKYELGNAPIHQLLVKYSMPAMVAMFVSSMYNLVDTIFVGYGAGTLALAALAVYGEFAFVGAMEMQSTWK